MTADSVPAPMVPAELKRIIAECEGAIARENVLGEQVVTVRWLKEQLEPLVDAATPAAPVPAAECHEEVTRKGHLEPCEKPAVALRIDPNEGTPYPVCVKHTRADMVPLRALVAAAEQADKGEGGQRGGKSQDTATPHEPPLTAPAAPVGEPPCTCGLDRDPIPGARHIDACPKRPARVPVNDEAEAELDNLRRWKAEATQVMDGLQDLGKELGLPLGTQVTGPKAVEAVRLLKATREGNHHRPVVSEAAKALEDAAKAIDLSEFYDPDPRGQVSQECGHAETAAHRWLMDRAARGEDA